MDNKLAQESGRNWNPFRIVKHSLLEILSEGAARDLRPDILAVLISRVFMFTILYALSGSGRDAPLANLALLVYGLSTVVFLGTWIFLPRMARRSPIGGFLFAQFIIEWAAESIILLDRGGYTTDFGLLFILTIVSAGLFFRYTGALALASLSALTFSLVGMAHLGFSLPGSFSLTFPLEHLELSEVQVRFFLFISLYYLVALLTTGWSRQLSDLQKALEGASEQLSLARFSAEQMVEGMPHGALVLDSEGKLRQANAEVGRLLGRASHRMQPWQDVLGDLHPIALLQNFMESPQRMDRCEFDAEAASGAPLRILGKRLGHEGQELGWIFTLIDLTEEKRLEKSLVRQERMIALGEMSARLAHEIRNPLASIHGSAQMLGEVPAMKGENSHLLGLILTESERLNRFLTDLLDFVRDRQPAWRPVSAIKLLNQVEGLLLGRQNSKSQLARIEKRVENGDVVWSCDPDLLMQVLLNLGINALEAMPGAEVSLIFDVQKSGEEILIRVIDNGPGMDETLMAKVFDPFYTTKPRGTGLGLAVCLHNVHALSGNITLNSTLGRGTDFLIRLPSTPA